jgi:CPA2 family monovalent cation:H+ antiporter-2
VLEHYGGTAVIATICVSLAVAFVAGLLAVRLRLPPLIGYLLAGVVVGPFTPGFVADPHLAAALADIGVMLLMFGVGMHFSLGDLLAVRTIALSGAVTQMATATALALAVTRLWGWPLGAGLVFGLALSVASTVVVLRVLEAQDALDSADGRIAVGWLIVQDLVMVLTLVLLPALAGVLDDAAPGSHPDAAGVGMLWTLGLTLAKVAAFMGLMGLVGARLLQWVLDAVVRTGSRELFTVAVVAVALGVAYGAAGLFDVSFALGAFFAGMVINESDHSHRAAAESQPIQDAFAVLFFVSVGMLLNPQILVRHPLQVLTVLAIIYLGNSLSAWLIVKAFRYPRGTAFTVAAALAQIGEFSFILAGLSMRLGLLPAEGQDLILAGAILSITLNPLAFRTARVLQGVRRPPAVVPAADRRQGTHDP